MSRVCRWSVAYPCDRCHESFWVFVAVEDDLVCAKCCRETAEELLAAAKEAEEEEEAMR